MNKETNIEEYIQVLKENYIKESEGRLGIFYKVLSKDGKVHYRIYKNNDNDKWYIAIRLKLPEYKIDGLYILTEIYDSDHLNDWINSITAEHIKVKPIGFIKL